MGLLEQARQKLIHLCDDRKLGETRLLQVTSLAPDEAIGAKASSDFAIKKGKERVIEATFEGAHGQAFTDRPSRWAGTLSEAMSVDLTEVRSRAVFVAAMNAVMRFLGAATGTMHCLDTGSEKHVRNDRDLSVECPGEGPGTWDKAAGGAQEGEAPWRRRC